MKKNITLLSAILATCFTLTGYAQSQRMVFIEEATQASCPPCATANPPLQVLMNANADKVIFLAYQVWWPGVDAMYEDNKPEVNSRIGDYYPTIGGAPNVVVQGSSGGQSVSYASQSRINTIAAQTSEFDLDIAATIDNGVLSITGSAIATAAVTGNLKLRLIIAEELIVNDDLAFIGTNGETEFHHVFKKFVNGPAGITLPNSWVPGDTLAINQTFDLGTLNIYNYDQVEVMAIIQNDANKAVLQAAKADHLPITTNVATSAAVSGVKGLPKNICSGTQELSPEFKIQNTGNDTLTSATILYNVNGGADQSYDWTGSLTTYKTEFVALPSISFTAEAANVVNISVTNPNGMVDENTADDATASSPVPLALEGKDSVTVKILTDNYADETYWEIRNGAGDVVISGGNPNVGLTNINTGNFPPPPHPNMYANATLYEIGVPISAADCFIFHITDYYGDGMTLSTVPAYYKVVDGDGVELVVGIKENFGETKTNFLGDVTVVSGTKELASINAINIFPNPVTETASLTFNLVASAEASIAVSNIIGQEVYSNNLGSLSSGAHATKIDMSSLENGLYLVQIRINNEVVTRKITVAR